MTYTGPGNTSSLIERIELHHRKIIAGFFLAFLLLGILIHRDFTPNHDSAQNIHYGKITQKYISNGLKDIDYHPGIPVKYTDDQFTLRHGPFFESVLHLIGKAFRLEGRYAVYCMRRAACFLFFFIGCIFFYLLCKECFGSWKTGLLGTTFLALHPWLFEHVFENSIDPPYYDHVYHQCFYNDKIFAKTKREKLLYPCPVLCDHN